MTIHHLIDGFLDGVCHDLRLIDHGVMHGPIKQLLELHGVFIDGDVSRCRKSTFLDDLPFSSHKVERLNSDSLEAVAGLGQLLLLSIVKMFLGDVEDVVVADLRSIT